MAKNDKVVDREVETALVHRDDSTLALLQLGEDLFLTPEQENEIIKSFTREKFVRPFEILGDRVALLKFEAIGPFTLSTGNRSVNMVVASAALNPRLRIRFIESAGMRGQFIASRIGLKFAMEYTGDVTTGKPQPVRTYNFAWER